MQKKIIILECVYDNEQIKITDFLFHGTTKENLILYLCLPNKIISFLSAILPFINHIYMFYKRL